MIDELQMYNSRKYLLPLAVAQQSVHLTLGILRTSQAVFYALSFFWLDGFAVPAPAQVTQTVGRLASNNEIQKSHLENRSTNFHHISCCFLSVFFEGMYLVELRTAKTISCFRLGITSKFVSKRRLRKSY
jgi:hypothetical protein